MCTEDNFMVLAYALTWPEELNVTGYACAKFQFPFCEFYKESFTYPKGSVNR
jgi:hypothetical protein